MSKYQIFEYEKFDGYVTITNIDYTTPSSLPNDAVDTISMPNHIENTPVTIININNSNTFKPKVKTNVILPISAICLERFTTNAKNTMDNLVIVCNNKLETIKDNATILEKGGKLYNCLDIKLNYGLLSIGKNVLSNRRFQSMLLPDTIIELGSSVLSNLETSGDSQTLTLSSSMVSIPTNLLSGISADSRLELANLTIPDSIRHVAYDNSLGVTYVLQYLNIKELMIGSELLYNLVKGYEKYNDRLQYLTSDCEIHKVCILKYDGKFKLEESEIKQYFSNDNLEVKFLYDDRQKFEILNNFRDMDIGSVFEYFNKNFRILSDLLYDRDVRFRLETFKPSLGKTDIVLVHPYLTNTNSLFIYKDKELMVDGVDYTEVDNYTIRFLEPFTGHETIVVRYYESDYIANRDALSTTSRKLYNVDYKLQMSRDYQQFVTMFHYVSDMYKSLGNGVEVLRYVLEHKERYLDYSRDNYEVLQKVVTNSERYETEEATRVSNENTRISAEKIRSESEQGRVLAESSRDSAESSRSRDENTRVQAETVREANEELRKKAYSDAKSAITKVMAEADKAEMTKYIDSKVKGLHQEIDDAKSNLNNEAVVKGINEGSSLIKMSKVEGLDKALQGKVSTTDLDEVISVILGNASLEFSSLQKIESYIKNIESKLTKKVVKAVGNGEDDYIIVKHNLDSLNVVASVRHTSQPHIQVLPGIVVLDSNNIALDFDTPPNIGEYTVTILA